MAAETITFKIDDQQYEVPSIEDLDMDEWQIMYEYGGFCLDDFAPLAIFDEEGNLVGGDEDAEAARQRKLRQPAFTRALLHIGYARANPELKPQQVKAVTGKAKLIRVMEAMDEAVPDEDDAGPLALTSEPEQSSPESSPDFSKSGSAPSETSSGQPEKIHAATGTSG